MQSIDSTKVNEGSFKTFSHGFVIPGDIVYLPFGHILTEKATGNNNVSLRVPSMLVHDSGLSGSAELLSLAYPQKLACYV